MYLFKKSSFVFSLLFISGCGYQAAGSCPKGEVVSVTVPSIREDEDGVLQDALAHALSRTGRYRYTSYSAPYELIVKVEKTVSDTIGSREGRKTVTALVTLRNRLTKEAVLEPFRVSAQANYDFVNSTVLKDIEFKGPDGRKERVLQYSLGQLDSEEGAKGEVQSLLFEELARKIGEAIVRVSPYEKKKE